MKSTAKLRGSFSKRPTAAVALVIALAAILVGLAILQYRWTVQLSDAERERKKTSLTDSMENFRRQLHFELQQVLVSFQPDRTILQKQDWKAYAESCDRALTDHHLVKDVYLWLAGGNGGSSLLLLNRDRKEFEPTAWPAEFEPVRNWYANWFSERARPDAGMGPRPFGWFIHRIDLMLHPLREFPPIPEQPGPDMPPIGCVLLELNVDTMRSQILPELVQRYFNGQDGFIVAVMQGPALNKILYKSDPQLADESFADPDDRAALFDPFDRIRPGSPRPERAGLPPPMPRSRREPSFPRYGRLVPILSISDPNRPGLELVAKHREGSLEAAVATSRHRNLALSFGILLLLAMSMALIIVLARRAQRLAKLQIDFVAGVSHELRTPLAVICSAGDNLADGVVADSGPAQKYGELIRSEGRKLAGMIEQILAYASLGRDRNQYNLRPASLNDLAEAALKNLLLSIAAENFSIDKNLDPDLPMINVDSAALSQTIQNLIQNAMKYSGESRWLAVRTEKARTKHGIEVRLTIEDRGMGIEGEDLRHIFEPFYRGGTATAAQIHGTGLGLFMVREAVNSMGGSITVNSSRGIGSAFTIHFRSLPDAGTSPAAATGDPEHAVQNTVDRG